MLDSRYVGVFRLVDCRFPYFSVRVMSAPGYVEQPAEHSPRLEGKTAAKRILLFGGSGGLGQCLTQAAAIDNAVYIVTRNPDKYKGFSNDNVKVISCKIEAEPIKEAIEEHKIDTVVSTLSFEPKPDEEFPPGHLNFARAAVAAMKQTNCKRLVVISTWFADPETRNCGDMGCLLWCSVSCILAKVFLGHYKADEYLQTEAGEIEWTSCRSPILEMGPAGPDQQGFEVEHDVAKVSGVNYWKGSREDTARFMLEAISRNDLKGHVAAFGRENSPWCCCCC